MTNHQEPSVRSITERQLGVAKLPHRRRPLGRFRERAWRRVSRPPLLLLGRDDTHHRDREIEPHSQGKIRAGWNGLRSAQARDVVLIEGSVEAIPIGTNPVLEDAHAKARGFDSERSGGTSISASGRA